MTQIKCDDCERMRKALAEIVALWQAACWSGRLHYDTVTIALRGLGDPEAVRRHPERSALDQAEIVKGDMRALLHALRRKAATWRDDDSEDNQWEIIHYVEDTITGVLGDARREGRAEA